MFPSFIRRARVCSGCSAWSVGKKVLHLTYNLHGKGSVVRGEEDGGNDEAGMLANTIPSGETERVREQCMRGKEKLRRFASGDERREEKARGTVGQEESSPSLSNRGGPLLANCHISSSSSSSVVARRVAIASTK